MGRTTTSASGFADHFVDIDLPSYAEDGKHHWASAPKPDPCVIACMGPTGSGKSSFMSMIGDIEATIGHDIESCTQTVDALPTIIDGQDVTLVDTPGFDDTNNGDTEILRLIAGYLEASYKEGFLLSGIIYFHRITDNRVGGVTAKNMRLFRSLCGDNALTNVILCTTMWDLVDPAVGERREKSLRERFWKDMIQHGSTVVRHDNTQESALNIVRRLIGTQPVVLDLQDQLVNQGFTLLETQAGRVLNAEILKLQAGHKQEMESLQREMERSSGRKLDALKAEWEAEAEKLRQSQQSQELLAAARASEVEALRAEIDRRAQEREAELACLRDEFANKDREREAEMENLREMTRKAKDQAADVERLRAEIALKDAERANETSGLRAEIARKDAERANEASALRADLERRAADLAALNRALDESRRAAAEPRVVHHHHRSGCLVS